MFMVFHVLVSLVLSSISALDVSDYKPEHSFKDGVFTKMDGIVLKISSGELNLVSSSHVFTDNEKQSLLESAKASNMYSVRIPVRNDEYIEASIQSCQIIASRMRVKFTVSVNDLGDPIAIHMSTPKYNCPYDISTNYLNLPDLSITLELQKPKLGSRYQWCL
ncbi:ER membrane protein complex subunit 10 [Schistosoma japonicum]|nr:ER membrane protein complex subunit 10 [Schistosoma japonicum]